MKCRVASRLASLQLTTKYPKLPILLIGQIKAIVWRIGGTL